MRVSYSLPWIIGLALLAVVAYYLPWIWHPAAALSPNARDLAEWTTLMPTNRMGALPLVPSFLLRSVAGWLSLAILILSTRIPTRYGIVFQLLALALIVSLLPPLEFFTSSQNDVNYRQQFFLAALYFLAGGATLVSGNRWQSWHRPVLQITFVAAVLSSLLGYQQAHQWAALHGISGVVHGGGLVLIILACSGAALLASRAW